MIASVERAPLPGLPGLQSQTYTSLQGLPADVMALFLPLQQQDPQLSLPWLQNLAGTALLPAQQLQVHVLRRQRRAIAALPLLVANPKTNQGPIGAQQVQALANYYSSLVALPMAPDLSAAELAQLLHHLLQAHVPLARLQWAPMDPQQPGFELLRQAMSLAGLRPFDYFCFGNWHLPVEGDAAAYLAGRPGELRNTLRRMGKKFAAAGGSCRVVTDVAEAAFAAAEFTRIYNISWKQPEPHPAFIPGLVQLCAQQSWLRLGLASVKGQVVAAQLWTVAGGKASIFKLAYDPAFKQLSPGSLLTAHLMQHVIDTDRVAEVDYLTGDDTYKPQWMSQRRERRGLVAYNPRTLAGLAGWAREVAARASRPLRDRLQRARGEAGPAVTSAESTSA